jgi:hypothetical protein
VEFSRSKLIAVLQEMSHRIEGLVSQSSPRFKSQVASGVAKWRQPAPLPDRPLQTTSTGRSESRFFAGCCQKASDIHRFNEQRTALMASFHRDRLRAKNRRINSLLISSNCGRH